MISSLLALSFAVSIATPQSAPLSRFTFTQYHMGIDARLTVYAKNQTTAETACIAAFSRIAELDSIMSDYRKSSELNRLCDKSGSSPVWVSRDLFMVLAKAQAISKQSMGAFDVSVGPLVSIWRQARRSATLPKPEEISSARRIVGWQKVKLHAGQRVQLLAKGMKLDLGGIAKGYAGDEAQRVLQRQGIKSAMVEMGGDIVVSDPPPGLDGWTLRVPNAGKDKGPADLKFSNCAISSSGDTEQFTVIGGIQYSHVIDPRTGMALTNRAQSTVVSKWGLDSDPLSTALTVLDEAGRAKLLAHYPGVTSYTRVVKGQR